jgi:alkanesulfonate monooxygenase
VARLRELAVENGRQDGRQDGRENGRCLRFGLRVHVLSRDTAGQAWAEADRIQAGFDPAVVAGVQQRMSRMDSVGQARMAALRGGLHGGAPGARAADLTVSPNLWAGIGLVREGVGTALVGDHAEVAERLEEYAGVGIDEFILSGYPHLEEALRFGEHVLPLVRAKYSQAVPV